MAQQTAVEWFIEQLKNEEGIDFIPTSIIEQAKQMEKEQLENARPQITSNCVIKEISDEEIEDVSGGDVSFEFGAKWYREQLKLK